MATNRLGKGLSALLGDEVDLATNDERFIKVDIKKMKPNPNQARKAFNEDEIAELAESIKQHGVIQPVLLNEDSSGGYIIVAGERRYRAAKKAGIKELPAIIKKLNEQELMEVSLIENLQRVDLNAVEEAVGIRDLMEKCSLNHEQVADRLGKSRPSVTNSLRLLKLPPEVLNMLREDKISKGHAKCLLGLDDDEMIIYFAEQVVEDKLSVRALEQLIASGEKKTVEREKKQPSPQMREVLENLSERLGTKVSMGGSESKGVIKIEYYSVDELNSIIDTILK